MVHTYKRTHTIQTNPIRKDVNRKNLVLLNVSLLYRPLFYLYLGVFIYISVITLNFCNDDEFRYEETYFWK